MAIMDTEHSNLTPEINEFLKTSTAYAVRERMMAYPALNGALVIKELEVERVNLKQDKVTYIQHIKEDPNEYMLEFAVVYTDGSVLVIHVKTDWIGMEIGIEAPVNEASDLH